LIYIGPEEVSLEHGTSLVDEAMAERAIKNLYILESINQDPITVILNTGGGSVTQGFAIYDTIKACKSHVTMIATGECSSMGTIILQAADKRIVDQHVTFMIHVGTLELPQDHVKNVKNAMKWDEQLEEYCNSIYLEKIHQKHPHFTKHQLNSKLEFDRYLTANEAVELGLADEVK
jgi:ATP-dependent Clp protease protease subunit